MAPSPRPNISPRCSDHSNRCNYASITRLPVLFTLWIVLAVPTTAQDGAQTPKQREARFVAADQNRYGSLDKAEFVASTSEQAQRMADQLWLSRVDAYGDVFVTNEQYIRLLRAPRPQ